MLMPLSYNTKIYLISISLKVRQDLANIAGHYYMPSSFLFSKYIRVIHVKTAKTALKNYGTSVKSRCKFSQAVFQTLFSH